MSGRERHRASRHVCCHTRGSSMNGCSYVDRDCRDGAAVLRTSRVKVSTTNSTGASQGAAKSLVPCAAMPLHLQGPLCQAMPCKGGSLGRRRKLRSLPRVRWDCESFAADDAPCRAADTLRRETSTMVTREHKPTRDAQAGHSAKRKGQG